MQREGNMRDGNQTEKSQSLRLSRIDTGLAKETSQKGSLNGDLEAAGVP